MAFVLAIFFVLLVVGIRTSNRAARKQNLGARRGGPMQSGVAPRMTSTPLPRPASTTGVFQPGNSATYAPGDSPTYRPGNAGTYAPGDSPTYRPGDTPTYRPGDSATYAPGNSPTYRPGDSPTYAPGDSPTYAPASPIGSRPKVGPPAGAPAASTTARRQPPRRGQQARPDRRFQPTYATNAERQTELRDQGVLDRDRRSAARTDPTQAPSEGSTAISSTSLDTSLVIPYQPSSLLTSLSTSLSSSLFDTPPRTAASSVFMEVPDVALPSEIEEEVVILLRAGKEVDAVRIVIDRMNVGILEATKTVRSYGGGGRR